MKPERWVGRTCTDLKGKMHGVCHINMIQQLTFRETENYLVQLGMCMTGCLADAYVHLLTLVGPVIKR